MTTYSECKTYSTYQEAKIAMPKACIIECKHKGELLFTFAPSRKTCKLSSGVKFSNPADHCMTVEQFLKENDTLPLGALIAHPDGSSNHLEDERMIDICSTDLDSFVVLPPALEEKEEKPKRVKVEYVKCEDEQAWTLVKEFEEGVEFYTCSKGLHTSKNIGNLLSVWRDGDLHRRIETPIEWWEDAVAFAQQCKQVITAVYLPEYDSIDIDGSMTRDEACDFARILLEQGE